MRVAYQIDPELGILPIEKVVIPAGSRDELPPVLAALQWIWSHPAVRAQIFALLEKQIIADKKPTGRTGMELWRILVLGVVRLALDADWDRLEHLANYDALLRALLGLNPLPMGGEAQRFHRRTLRDNAALLDAALLKQINALVAAAGREIFPDHGPMEVRVDSYVVETDVHFPTDFNLLWDAARKCLDFVGKFLQRGFGLPAWRKMRDWRRRLKSAERAGARASSGGGKNKDQRVKALVAEYLDIARELAAKLDESRPLIQSKCVEVPDLALALELDRFRQLLAKHIDLLDRRVLQGETIPVAEKIYSLFEPHTEWISKGKAHRPVELGHRLLVATEQNQLIVDYKTPAGPDANETIGVADRVLGRFGSQSVASMSFDKGFTCADDKELLKLYIPLVVMPKRGKKTEAQVEEEKAPKFQKRRRAHSAVESAINALEHHGLNRCLDQGLAGFERYAGYGVLAYNLHLIGRELQRQRIVEQLVAA